MGGGHPHIIVALSAAEEEAIFTELFIARITLANPRNRMEPRVPDPEGERGWGDGVA